MKLSTHHLFLGAAVACVFTLTLVALAQDENKPTPPPAAPPPSAVTEGPEKAAAPATKADAPATSETPAAGPVEKDDKGLHRIDSAPDSTPRRHRMPHVQNGSNGNQRVSIANDVTLAAGESADALVAVAGSATSEGDVSDAVVSVLGSSTVTGGSVGDAVVSVLGNTYVNTKIGGEAVAVLGDVELGPKAEIGGDVVSVGGTVKRDPAAIVHGSVQNVSIAAKYPHFGGLQTWIRECLFFGRPLAFKPGLGFAWTFALSFFVLYVIIALLFGGIIDKGATTLETRPGASLLAALLTLLLTPIVFVLLCVTVVGIAVIPFLVIGLFIAGLFGKTIMLAWVGRRITRLFELGPLNHAAFATLIGAIIMLVLYTVPFLGFTVQKATDILGLGVVVFMLTRGSKKAKPAGPGSPAPGSPVVPEVVPGAPAVPSDLPAAGAAASGITSDPIAGAAGATVATPPVTTSFTVPAAAVSSPPRLDATMLPRAGFLIRLAAMILDMILVGIIVGMLPRGLAWSHGMGGFLILLAAYGAVMWKLKGTTIGGVVCGLKVVRVDHRELDWATALVRALGCFLSMAVVGLGFIWVAIDDERQSWHDKIAGTTVVMVPKGTSLI